jgi:site-specific DNA recombinase
VIVGANRIDIRMSRAKIAAALEASVRDEPNLDPVVLSIEAKLRRAGKGKRLIIANGANAEVNQGLVEFDQGSFCDPKPAPLRFGR